jgi:hypothetical protein
MDEPKEIENELLINISIDSEIPEGTYTSAELKELIDSIQASE